MRPPRLPFLVFIPLRRKMARFRVTYESSHAALAEEEGEGGDARCERRCEAAGRRRKTEEMAVARLWGAKQL